MLRPALATEASTLAMPIRLRKFIGAVALLVLVIVWALVAMALAQAPVIRDNWSLAVCLLRDRRNWLGAAGHADHRMDERGQRISDRKTSRVYAASSRRKPFHIAVAAPDSSTRT